LLLRWNAATPGPVTATITNLQGGLVQTARLMQAKGMQQQAVDVHTLQSGLYIITLRPQNGSGTSLRFMKL
jgi:hypothetical protein